MPPWLASLEEGSYIWSSSIVALAVFVLGFIHGAVEVKVLRVHGQIGGWIGAHNIDVLWDRRSDLLRTGEITEGDLPRRQAKLAIAWAELHQEELMANWDLVMNGEEPFRIQPLQ